MNVEIMIYVYLFVCTSMIAFNIVTACLFRYRAKKTVAVSEKFRLLVSEQLRGIRSGQPCSDAHKKYMRKSLKRVGNMIAFDTMLEASYIEAPESVKGYLAELDRVFTGLCADYCGKGRIEAAYFPYIVKKYRLLAEHSIPSIEEAMYRLLDDTSIYCRENALQALYTTGNCGKVLAAIKKIDRSDLFFHGKLLCDGLLNFDGNTEKLIDGIIEEFENFSDEMKVTLLNYMRFSSAEHREFAYVLLCGEKRNDEIRYCAIRYLGKYRYEEAYELLCGLAQNTNSEKWQYCAIASTALAAYPSERTISILKENLYSRNWYVRCNSARSLNKLGLTYSELCDVIDGEDRYASEILRYMLDVEKDGRRLSAV